MNFNTNVARVDKNFMNPQGIRDLEQQFGDYTPLVLQIIVFLGLKSKNDLFNMFTTTVDEFSRYTGIDKSTLNRAVPLSGDLKRYPEYQGHVFKSYFDYTIFLMVSRNWVFSRPVYNYNSLNAQTGPVDAVIKSVKILESILVRQLPAPRAGTKHYEFRLNEFFLTAMQRQYWPVDYSVQRSLGQFRKSKNLRSLYLCVSGMKHSAISNNNYFTTLPMSELAKGALIKDGQEPKHVKQAIQRMLTQIQNTPNSGMSFQFTHKDKYKEDYWIHMSFTGGTLESQQENLFHFHLLNNLNNIYHKQYKSSYPNEKFPFQRWIINSDHDMEKKVAAIQAAYYSAYKKVPEIEVCYKLLKNGISDVISDLQNLFPVLATVE